MKLFLTILTVMALSLSISTAVFAKCGCGCGGGKAEKPKEEKVTLDQCPEKVQETIKKEAEGGTIGEIEKITKGETVTYEAEITIGEDKYELTVSSEGKLLKKEAEDEEENDEDED